METQPDRVMLPEPKLRLLFRVEAQVAERFASGEGSGGFCVESVREGSFSGPAARGSIISGGITRIREVPSGTRLEGKYNLKTDDGAILYAQLQGTLKDGAGVAHLTFTAASKKYAFLGDVVALSAVEYAAGETIIFTAYAME